MTDNDDDTGQTSDAGALDTSAFRAVLHEQDALTEGPVVGPGGMPTGSALLVVTRGPNAGSRFLLNQPVTSAGRHRDSDIFCDDVTVSRRHAEVRRDGDDGGFHIVDVGSLNDTYVNRQAMESTVLADGDEVQIGTFRLVFLTGPPTDGDQ